MGAFSRVYKLYRSLHWYLQYRYTRTCGKFANALTLLQFDDYCKILYLAPHSDDEWVGGYQLLRVFTEKVTVLYFNRFGGNIAENNVLKRNSEIVLSSMKNNFRLENNFSYDVRLLLELLKKHQVVFLPSPYDWHDEHREVFKTFYKAYQIMSEDEQRNVSVFYYNVSVPHHYTSSLYYLPLSKNELNRKWNDFVEVYFSQKFMPAYRYKLQSRLVPKYLCYAAEQYLKVDKQTIEKDYLTISNKAVLTALNSLKFSINNIYQVRILLHKIVESIL